MRQLFHRTRSPGEELLYPVDRNRRYTTSRHTLSAVNVRLQLPEVAPDAPRKLAGAGSPTAWALVVGALLIVLLGGRAGASSLASRLLIPTLTPTAIPTATPFPATPTRMPTATPIPTDTPAPPTPTVDATEVLRRAAIAATLTAPTPLPTASPTPYFIKDGDIVRRSDAPITLRIPKIGVDAQVESVGLDSTGAMATPTTAFRVAWYDGGPLPGQPGNAVIDGHLDSRIYGMAVFWNLGKLAPGDKVEVEMPGKRWLTFVVERVAVYPYDDAPLDEIFGPSQVPHLNLITCSGIFDRSSHNYDRRRVVYTRLDDS